MGKDESKKEAKRAKRQAEATSAALGDVSMASAATDGASDDKAKRKAEKKAAKAAAAAAGGVVVQEDDDDDETAVNLEAISPIAHPLAHKKLSKRVLKTIKKASKSRGHVKRGVKEVVKGLRKGEKGLVIMAGDISPLDILSHIPVLCEETDNPYVFVQSKDELGAASSTKRPTSVVMICPTGLKGKKELKEDYTEEYGNIHTEVKSLDERVVLGA